MTGRRAAIGRGLSPRRWRARLAVLMLVVGVILAPMTGAGTAHDAGMDHVSLTTDAGSHGDTVSCCDDTGHTGGVHCAACLFAVISAPAVAPRAADGQQYHFTARGPAFRPGGPGVPHGPPRVL